MNGRAPNTLRFILAHLCALVVGGYFLYAASFKIGPNNTRQFAIEVKNYKILDAAYVNIPAVFLPWCEVGAALALLFPKTRRAGAILIVVFLIVFIAAVSYSALHLGLKISCGCTGEGSAQAGWTTIARNTALFAATLASVFLLPSKKSSFDQ